MNFFSNFILFQDLYTSREKGIGRENIELYIYKGAGDINKKKIHGLTVPITEEDYRHWPMRLGHHSAGAIKTMGLGSVVNNDMLNKCVVCPLAK